MAYQRLLELLNLAWKPTTLGMHRERERTMVELLDGVCTSHTPTETAGTTLGDFHNQTFQNLPTKFGVVSREHVVNSIGPEEIPAFCQRSIFFLDRNDPGFKAEIQLNLSLKIHGRDPYR